VSEESLTLPSLKERVLKKSEVKVLSFGEDLGGNNRYSD